MIDNPISNKLGRGEATLLKYLLKNTSYNGVALPLRQHHSLTT